MKRFGTYASTIPLALLLSACSQFGSEQAQPIPAQSELGQPLAQTGSGDALVERQRVQAQAEQRRQVTRKASSRPTLRPLDAGPTGNGLGNQPVQLNFVEADIPAVVRALSRATGRQFLVDPRVKGQLTLVSEGEVPARTAYDMLLAALRMQGFAVVEVEGVSQVVPEADAKLLGGPVGTPIVRQATA